MSDGLDVGQLARVKAAIEADIAAGKYYGAVFGVSRRGMAPRITAVGKGDSAGLQKLADDSVFSIFSITKGFTNLLIFQAIDRGQLALTTRVADVIPEFKGGLREKITFYHLLSQSSGLPPIFSPGEGQYIDKFEEVLPKVLALAHCQHPPG